MNNLSSIMLLIIGGVFLFALGMLYWLASAWQYDSRSGDAWEVVDKSYTDEWGVLHTHYEPDCFSYGLRVNRRTGRMQKTISHMFYDTFDHKWVDITSVEQYKLLMSEAKKYWEQKSIETTLEAKINAEKEAMKKQEWQRALEELVAN